ncbi:hypothetical protein [Gluconobacter wancherniae]|uniref:hypothetical protein n=1 Tax=Gluconobacter wancherniae TaxID=1307955 RepID=UPI001B8AB37D|nr:hypothetical protein [Gluconobacter wancherniae]MBS1095201.1 hypothetical protein [Gluconobacter wancherniae]
MCLLDFVSGVLGIVSAYFWYRATQGDIPSAPNPGDEISAALFQELFQVINKQSGYNKKAALSACLMAAIQGIKLLF